MKWCGTGMVALASIAVLAAPASAAEVVAGADGGTVTAQRGRVTNFQLTLAATGAISCGTRRNNPARAVADTQYLLVGGRNAPSGVPGAPRPFYSNDQLTGIINCGTHWDTKPQPYKVSATLAVAPNTAVGTYRVPLNAVVGNPSAGGLGPLTNSQPDAMNVRVVEPARGLPNPQENRTVNLLPVRGNVLVRYPRARSTVALTKPIQVPVNTRVDSIDGFVNLVSDRDSFGSRQAMTFWNGVFTVNYTRATTPGLPQRASRPITELTLARYCPRSSRAAAAAGVRDPAQTSRRRRKRRGVFGKGRGRFRTRGSYGAGTVRGTTWYSESRCSGTLFSVSAGFIDVRDLSLKRNITLRAGQSYIALPRNRRRGSSAG